MTITNKQKLLIANLVDSNELDGRYTNIQCVSHVNHSAPRGSLSLVFKATDSHADTSVAIKVMDPEKEGDSYRLDAFKREREILEILIGRKRCVQLTSIGVRRHSWDIQADIGPVTNWSNYFVTEWLEEDMDDYVFKEDEYDATFKLEIFRGVLLAIQSIHENGLFHRDIKVDNIRLKSIDGQKIVVLIDFGSAARRTSLPIGLKPSNPKGANGYSPPEAFAGFSEDREIAHLADNYAAGALLFELFNYGDFHYLRSRRTEFYRVVQYMKLATDSKTSLSGKHLEWNKSIRAFNAMRLEPEICGSNSSVPPSIEVLVKGLYGSLICFDFNNRADDLGKCISKIDSALRALNNHCRQAKYYKHKALLRKRKIDKINRKQARHLVYLEAEGSNCVE